MKASVRWVSLCAMSMAALSVGCSSEATLDDGSSQSASTANRVDCDVDYSRLDLAWASQLHIEEPTREKISQRERIRNVNELSLMPDASKAIFTSGALLVELTGGSITEFAQFAKLRGVTPPGWEGTGYTWDVVPGTGTAEAVWLGDSGRPNNAYSLAVHEATHAIDLYTHLGETSAELQALYEADRTKHAAERDSLTVYRLGNIHEYLAVAVDERSCNANTRASGRAHFPELHQWIADAFDREVTARREVAPP